MRLSQATCAALIVAPLLGSAAAQSATLPPSRFGFTAGVNSSTISGNDLGDVSRRTSFMAGALVVVPLTSTVGIQPELLYSAKGVQTTDQGITITLKMDYVEVPVLLRVDVPTSGGTKPFLYAGPAISFKAKCSIDASGSVSSSTSCAEFESPGSKLNTVDYGLVVGGGLAFDVGGRTFSVGARFDPSFGKISNDGDSKHRVISVLGTFEFPWKR